MHQYLNIYFFRSLFVFVDFGHLSFQNSVGENSEEDDYNPEDEDEPCQKNNPLEATTPKFDILSDSKKCGTEFFLYKCKITYQ